MPQFNGDVIFLDGSGQVRATNGSLTLRGDDTGNKSIIIGSGESLRPERDDAIRLGRPDLRWSDMRAVVAKINGGELGAVLSYDQFLPFGAVTLMSGTVQFENGNVFFQNDCNVNFDGLATFNSVRAVFNLRPWIFANPGLGALDLAATMSDLIDARPASGSIVPSTDVAFRLGGPTKRWAQEYAASGIFNMLAASSSGTFIAIDDADLVPIADARRAFGSLSRRLARAHVASGIFNTLSAPSSGTFIGLDDIDLVPLGNARRAIGSLTQRLARVHVASGIFNTIGAPASGTFVDSAASIVPNRNNIYSLGTSTQRWGNLYATSGSITTLDTSTLNVTTINATTITAQDGTFTSNLTTGDMTIHRNLFLDDDGDGGQIVQGGPINWDIAGFTLDFANGTPSFSDILVTGTAFAGTLSASDVQSSTATFTSNVGITGTLTSRNIVPQTDRLYAIGTSALRYSRMHAASGLFNTIGPQSSGTFVNVIGSLVPERTALYSLGTSTLAWGNLFATSGTVTTLASTTINATDITTVGTLSSLGNFGVNGLAALNGGTFFGNSAAPSVDASIAMGLQGFRWAQLYAASGQIETINPLPSGGFLTVNGSIFPDQDLLRSLGGTVRRWATVQAGSGIFTTAASIKGAKVVTDKDARTTVHAVVTANSGAIISNTNEVDIYNYTIPGNTLSPSGKLSLECIGSLTNMSAAAVNMTPRVYVNGTQIWGDLFSVSQGPRPADFAIYTDICSLGSMTGQRVRGTVELATRTAASTAGNGDFGALNGGQGNWCSAAASGTDNFSNPIVLRVTMQLGTSSTLISYSGLHCILSHQPFPTL